MLILSDAEAPFEFKIFSSNRQLLDQFRLINIVNAD